MAEFQHGSSDDGYPTHTTTEQHQTEKVCREVFNESLNPDGTLDRDS